MNRRHVDPAAGVDQKLAVGRVLDGVAAVALGESDQPRPIKIDAVVMNEIGILARHFAAGAEPDLPVVGIDAVDPAHDIFALGDLVLDRTGAGVDQVKVPPAVALRNVEDLVGSPPAS